MRDKDNLVCYKILHFIANLYPFEIDTKTFKRWNWIFTILYVIVFFNKLLSPKIVTVSFVLIGILVTPIYIDIHLKSRTTTASFANKLLCIFLPYMILFYIFILVVAFGYDWK